MSRRVAVAVLLGALAASAAAGCGKTDEKLPTGPGVSKAEPTGTVNTTLPRTTTTKG